MCFGPLAAGFGVVCLFPILCFTALFLCPARVGSSVRVSVAPGATVDKHKEQSWDRRTPRVTGVSVDPEQLCLVRQSYA